MIDWLKNPGFKVGTEDIYFGPPDQFIRYFLAGRPIGFQCLQGISTGDLTLIDLGIDVPLGLGIIHNDCNCPVSYYLPQTTPTDMFVTVKGA